MVECDGSAGRRPVATPMKMPRLNRRQRSLMHCAPFNDDRIADRDMRAVVFRVKKTEEFSHQRAFDRAIGDLVRGIAIPNAVTEWLSKGTFIATPRRTWRQMIMN